MKSDLLKRFAPILRNLGQRIIASSKIKTLRE
jgi:hypothetical protein